MNSFFSRLLRLALSLAALALLIGCAQDAPVTPPATVTAERPIATIPLPTEPPVPTGTPRATITPIPTPITPQITVEDQTLGEDGRLVFESVTSDQAGWLAVFADSDGEPGKLLGFEAIPGSTAENVIVTIDPLAATPTLHARLHSDAENSGEFDFPGGDDPLLVGRQEVGQLFTVDLDLPLPAVDIADQAIGFDGLVHVDNVSAPAPGWLAIHTLEGDMVGPVIGQEPVNEGENRDLAVPIRWREATAELAAVLYNDKERPGGFAPDVDLPVLAGGEAVMAIFAVQLPPDIFAYDQPVLDGKLVLERVIAAEPGWIVAFNDNEGQPGLIIGSARLNAGINENVELEVAENAVTPAIYLAIHEETNNPAEFNFPVADPAATFDDQVLPPTLLVTTPGNYLVTRDQEIGETNQVVVPLVVTDLDSWLVIYSTDESGQPDELLGRVWLPAGINRNSEVEVPASAAGQSLVAMLHQDAGEAREFDYPDGDDIPLQRNRQIIVSPFELYESSGTGITSP